MIDFKTAVHAALAFLAQAYPNANLRDFWLEEIELSPDEQFWYVTVSFARPDASTLGAVKALTGHTDRDYKVIAVRSDDSRVQSMKIRQLA